MTTTVMMMMTMMSRMKLLALVTCHRLTRQRRRLHVIFTLASFTIPSFLLQVSPFPLLRAFPLPPILLLFLLFFISIFPPLPPVVFLFISSLFPLSPLCLFPFFILPYHCIIIIIIIIIIVVVVLYRRLVNDRPSLSPLPSLFGNLQNRRSLSLWKFVKLCIIFLPLFHIFVIIIIIITLSFSPRSQFSSTC